MTNVFSGCVIDRESFLVVVPGVAEIAAITSCPLLVSLAPVAPLMQHC